MSYRQFNAKANSIAHYLRGRGVGPGKLVGIYARRSVEMVAAVYGVLKAGGAYVPMDPDHPAERSRFVVEDAGIDLVLTQEALAGQIDRCGAEIVILDDTVLAGADTNPSPAAAADLAYGIYTSGSTGKPKGTLIEHGALANYIQWAVGQYLGGEVLDFPLFSSFAFDLTVTSLFVPLQVGGRLVIYPEEKGGMDLAVLQVLAEDQVDVIKLTPSHLNLLRGQSARPSRLKKLIVGGEDFKVDLAQGVLASLGDHLEIYNEYGPTEATVGCMIHRFDPQRDRGGSVPIGRPGANAQIYLLDEYANPVALGVEGELYLGGPGLARGYLNRPDLNAQAFVDNPFQPGQRLYRSGDRARWSELGSIEFLGRRDDQVKIRGVRIELAEIEAAVGGHPLVEACAVRPVAAQANRGEASRYCRRCGLADNHPQAHLNQEGVCAICLEYDQYKTQAQAYFKNRQQLQAVFADAKATKGGEYDCLMLLSGGKDSTYVLYQLVEMGLKPLVFSMDNGYISDGAKANIRRAVEDLGLDLVFASTPAMNEIFVDSLKRHSNVCNGCFKTIYTLSVKLAKEKGIKYIVTGLSRGQFFETRVADLFHGQIFNPAEVDSNIIEARKAYHRMDDAVSRCLDVSVFADDSIFDEIQFIDFYRYCDVTLAEMYAFLDSRAPWVRPADTGRSTNCLINEAGIYLHKRERGFHNYALPYSWDVRLGHKQRQAALEELDDDIDENRVRQILDEIGYELAEAKGGQELRLAVYYTAADGLDAEGLKAYLAARLPDYMIPSFFVALDQLPLTVNGKVDRAALPQPDGDEGGSRHYVAPTTANERILAQVWSEVLRLGQVGVEDHFFDLGGDSILSIQIVARARQQGLLLEPTALFEHPTVAALAAVARPVPGRVEGGAVAGEVPLTTIQRWFLAQEVLAPHHWNQSLVVEVPADFQAELIEAALNGLVAHHDGLRLRFEEKGPGQWRQYLAGDAPPIKLERIDLSGDDWSRRQAEIAEQTQMGMDLASGCLLRAALFEGGAQRPRRLLLAVHHLAVDGVSWSFLLEDLETAYHQLSRGQSISLPPKTASYKAWAETQAELAASAAVAGDLAYWRRQEEVAAGPLPVDGAGGKNTVASARRVSVELDPEATEALLRQVPSVYNTKVDEVLLTALAQTLLAWSGGDALRVDLEAHGRDGGDGLDVSRTAGWFTALFPVVLQLDPLTPPGDAIKTVKEQLRQVPAQGRAFALSERSGYRSGAELLFNYLGQMDQLLPQASALKLVGGLELSRDPESRRQHLLEVAAYVRGGKLADRLGL